MKRLPIGVEDFKELVDHQYYYIDKIMFIQDVLKEKVVLYTRPRRFGKTLNMSMLYYFFSIKQKENAYLFDRLNITKNKGAAQYQNQYPVILITLIFRLCAAIQEFSIIYSTTKGGPGDTLMNLSLSAYRDAFTYSSIGKAVPQILVLWVIINFISSKLVKAWLKAKSTNNG